MIKLFTIGFTGKSAETFFNLLRDNGIKKLVDTRINNVSQLAGFTKGNDLRFFTKEILNIGYEHIVDLAPTKELLVKFRDKEISWEEYEKQYLMLLEQRKIRDAVDIETMNECCFLCSEQTPEQCHRRLLVEFLQNERDDIEIIHLL
jgi:uncharacterized protein YeaO (DUF488 family)